ncbi:hypothetical protein [Prosthecobacter sp.]|uniref:hypothetical protein n=1 Tax=Prosthecobacter sp. TaxID=1965333 RepID=UPI0037852604
MNTLRRLSLLALLLLSGHLPLTSRADDTPESVNARLRAGTEVAWIIEDTLSADGDLAVLFTSRLKGTPPAAFPYLVTTGHFNPAATDAPASHEGAQHAALDPCTTQNIIVSLKSRRVLGRIPPGEEDESDVHFPGYNHRSLEALWLPAQAQASHRLVLLHYGGRFSTRDMLLIELSDQPLRQTSIASVLDATATDYLKTALKDRKDFPVERFAIHYELKHVLPPDAAHRPGGPVKVIIEFTAEVPKSDTAPSFDAAMTVQLQATAEKLSAQVLSIKASPAPTGRG